MLLRGLLGVMPVSRTSCAARFLNKSITHTPFQSLDNPSRLDNDDIVRGFFGWRVSARARERATKHDSSAGQR